MSEVPHDDYACSRCWGGRLVRKDLNPCEDCQGTGINAIPWWELVGVCPEWRVRSSFSLGRP